MDSQPRRGGARGGLTGRGGARGVPNDLAGATLLETRAVHR